MCVAVVSVVVPQVRHPHQGVVAHVAWRREAGGASPAARGPHGPGPVPDGPHQGLHQGPGVGESQHSRRKVQQRSVFGMEPRPELLNTFHSQNTDLGLEIMKAVTAFGSRWFENINKKL